MKDRPILFSAPMVRAILAGTKTQTRRVVSPRKDPDYGCELAPSEIAGDEHAARLCPYGQPGDRLWVREAWACTWKTPGPGSPVIYRAGHVEAEGDGPRVDVRWRPSIHMPRWASRITLEITSVRVERLQEISDEDCVREGCGATLTGIGVPTSSNPAETIPRAMFRELWQSINGPGSWDANPWVWVVEFKRVEAA